MDTPMKKEKMNVREMIEAKNGIDMLLQQVGIPRRNAWWLYRNRRKFETPIKNWQKALRVIADKYRKETPLLTHIPADKYEEFKKEMLIPMEAGSPEEAYNRTMEIFVKYEVMVPATDGIPPEKVMDYQEDANKEADKFIVEVEYMPIEANTELDEVMKKLSGEASAAIGYMLEEPSKLAIVR
jgi:hypothetical protein